MPPFTYYHIDSFSILVVIEHVTFTSVFSTTHILLSIDFTSALAEVSSPTKQSLDRPLGAHPQTSDRAITPSNGSRHYGGPYTMGE